MEVGKELEDGEIVEFSETDSPLKNGNPVPQKDNEPSSCLKKSICRDQSTKVETDVNVPRTAQIILQCLNKNDDGIIPLVKEGDTIYEMGSEVTLENQLTSSTDLSDGNRNFDSVKKEYPPCEVKNISIHITEGGECVEKLDISGKDTSEIISTDVSPVSTTQCYEEKSGVEKKQGDVCRTTGSTESKGFVDPAIQSFVDGEKVGMKDELDLERESDIGLAVLRTAESVSSQQLQKKDDLLHSNEESQRIVNDQTHSDEMRLMKESDNYVFEKEDLDILLARQELIRQQLEKSDAILSASNRNKASCEGENIKVPCTNETDKIRSGEDQNKSLDPDKVKNDMEGDVDDIDALLCRHEMIRQQLTLVNAVESEMNENTPLEKGGKKKRKGKKRKKLKSVVENGASTSTDNGNNYTPVLSPILPVVSDTVNKLVDLHESDKLDAAIDVTLLALRKEATTPSKKQSGNVVGPANTIKKPPKRMKIRKKLTGEVSAKKLPKNESAAKSKPSTKKLANEGKRVLQPWRSEFSKSALLKDINGPERFQEIGKVPRGEKNAALSKNAVRRRRKKRAKRLAHMNQASKPVKSKGILPYSAQQEREVKLLQKQQEAYDNYSNIPMEIEDDDAVASTGEVVAPLPLIEMPEIRPPSPPRDGDDFKPVEDHATLRMTRSNVAWMPGFVETLDIDVNVSSPKVEVIEEKSSPVVGKVSSSDVTKKEDCKLNEDDDADVWALRAQALKSLACKRAVRAKELNKSKKINPPNENVQTPTEDVVKTENIPSPEVRSPVIPVFIKPVDVISKNKKALYNKIPPPPPKHPRVIIPLSKEDFESDSDDDESECANERRVKVKVMSRRRKQVNDETLLKDLQGHIKRCRLRMKKNSSSIVKDQLIYKKLQNEISKQKILFEEQKEYVKKLQEELQLAVKQKTATLKTHNKLHQKIKDLKDQLKEKIQVRNTTDERILRAKTIVSVNRLRGNSMKNNINPRLKVQISSLIETLKISYQALLNAEKSYDLSSLIDTNANSLESNSNELKDEFSSNSNINGPNDGKMSSIGLRLDLPEVVEINDSPLDDTPNTDENITTTQCISSKESVSPNVVSNLEELKTIYSALSEPNDTSNITYTLSELLQGLGDAESLSVVQIRNESNTDLVKSVVAPHDADENYVDYKSPLTCFKSYRLSPKFGANSKFSLRSATFSNEIQPNMTICHYDLLGTCIDSDCSRIHLDEKCVISTHTLVNDLLSYQFNDHDGNGTMTGADKQRNVNLYTNQFMKKYGGKASLDKSASLLWNQLSEFCSSKKRKMLDGIILDDRSWFNQDKYLLDGTTEACQVDHYPTKYENYPHSHDLKQKKNNGCFNAKNENQEVRYFSKKYDSIALLKERLGENPSDVKLWLSLVQQILNTDVNNRKSSYNSYKKLSTNVREYALSVLSQALEENTCSEELWIKYLKLFSLNNSPDELRELCYQAVMYAADYDVWWTCLTLETTLMGKQEVCGEMISFIKDSELSAEKKSHYLTETILYNTQLLICYEKFLDSISYLKVALGVVVLPGDEHFSKTMIDVSKSLKRKDKSLLWLCLISVHAFKNLPRCIFNLEESGPGGLVNKDNFLLDWQNGSLDCSEDVIRLLFKNALYIGEVGDVSFLRDLNILYENVVAFELSLGNIDSAISALRGLLSEFPSFVDGWRLLMLLNFQFFPTADVISIGEEAVENCGADAKLVYFFCKELLKRNLPELALENLQKCILSYFKNEHNILDNASVVELFKRIIRSFVSLSDTSAEGDVVYYCLCYCLLTEESLQVSPMACKISTSEAFEYVINQYHSPENVKSLWIGYIQYRANLLSNMGVISYGEYQSFIDLLFQSLASVPAIGVIKENPNQFWRDYEFHNKLIDMCLTIIPINEHSKLYQKLLNFMPDNITLALRICKHEFDGGNQQQARVISNSLLSEFPSCLPLWNMAIKIELKCENVKEARWLLKEATKALPFCLSLWKELVKFEVFYSTNFDDVRVSLEEIKNQASVYGVSLREIVPDLI